MIKTDMLHQASLTSAQHSLTFNLKHCFPVIVQSLTSPSLTIETVVPKCAGSKLATGVIITKISLSQGSKSPEQECDGSEWHWQDSGTATLNISLNAGIVTVLYRYGNRQNICFYSLAFEYHVNQLSHLCTITIFTKMKCRSENLQKLLGCADKFKCTIWTMVRPP